VPLNHLLGLVREEVGGVGAKVRPRDVHAATEIVAPTVLK
jgi:hypothetical protein